MKKEKNRRITIHNLQAVVEIDEILIRKAVGLLMDEEGSSGELNVLFADDGYVKELNSRFLSKKSPTDVLAFPMDSEGVIGDIAVSADRALEQAAEYGHSVDRELALLAIHGALHLCGYRDGSPEERRLMEKRQDEILRKVFP